jgi:predicted amidohydrolase
VGEEPSYTFFGRSGVVGPRGKVYASVDEPTEGYAVATIDLDEVRQVREETQILQCRQPTAYRSVVKRY